MKQAITGARPLQVDGLFTCSPRFNVPFDLKRFGLWIEQYRRGPSHCSSKEWLGAGFAAGWYRGNEHRDPEVRSLPVTLTANRIGPVGMLLHPAELYSCYGLAICRGSPLQDTLVVGCAGGSIGYLPDPHGCELGDDAAPVVPKILDLPPYAASASAEMVAAAIQLLKDVMKNR